MSEAAPHGWFAMKRGVSEHEAFGGDFAKVGFFVWMVESAAYKAKRIDIAGKPYVVPRGALCYSQRFLAHKAKISVKSLRTFLATLERHGIIKVSVVKTGHARETQRTQITLCNYDKYQAFGNNRETTGKQPGNKEEQGNKGTIPDPTDQGGEPPVRLTDLKRTVWTLGKAYLSRHGVPDPGGMIGKWLKSASHAQLLEAIEQAEEAATENPVPYITRIIEGKPSGCDLDAIFARINPDGSLKQ